ncbi:MAG: tetratricopeptide repeat protein [Planctomycetes bacterium]|nr:tetratricopeptide repeat protein [Planctomycetota bacterium]NOG52962.1 tetratricopeptide repeat protein [Planctomycetota bacterium]
MTTDQVQQRIEQFTTMAEADPTNEMAHFSLGINLLQAGRHDEAIPSLARAIELNPEMSKAYQLLGESFKKAGNDEKAADWLKRGYEVAARRGDLMPKQAMEQALIELGVEPPAVEEAAPAEPLPDGSFVCHATGRAGTPLEKPPFRGRLGEKIHECISSEAWQAWISQGTKVINELRLDLSREEHQRIYDEHMLEFLSLSDWAAENL